MHPIYSVCTSPDEAEGDKARCDVMWCQPESGAWWLREFSAACVTCRLEGRLQVLMPALPYGNMHDAKRLRCQTFTKKKDYVRC